MKEELFKIKPLKLVKAKALDNNFLHVRYDVLNG